MDRAQLEKEYPLMFRLLSELWMDNGGGLSYWKPNFDDSFILVTGTVTMAELEGLASQLDPDKAEGDYGVPELKDPHYENEFELLAAGMGEDAEKLVAKKNLQVLDEFLNQCFDGDLNSQFWGR